VAGFSCAVEWRAKLKSAECQTRITADEDVHLRFRKLRIAWSVLCGLVAILLIMLWVRSYWVTDVLGRAIRGPSDTTLTTLISDRGKLEFGGGIHSQRNFKNYGWSYAALKPTQNSGRRLFFRISSKGTAIGFPTWLPAIFLVGAAVIPWMGLKWNFSLYTLLVAMTVRALVLSLVVLMARR
jgi:hypothetical protein